MNYMSVVLYCCTVLLLGHEVEDIVQLIFVSLTFSPVTASPQVTLTSLVWSPLMMV